LAKLNEAQRRELEVLRQAYQLELSEKVTAIAHTAAGLERAHWDTAAMQALHHLVHRLAGSSAIWGYTAVSKVAGELEDLVLSALQGTRGRTEELSGEVRRLLQALQHAVPPPRA
jgi:HPt (histidine-containing phosphotransfer) domain-containing protein